MKKLITKSILLILGLSQWAYAQSNITNGVNFFRRTNSMVAIDAMIASVQSEEFLGIQRSNAIQLRFIQVGNGGLTYTAQISLYNRYDEPEKGAIFTGELNLASCVRENGQNIFGQFKSLEEVLRYSHEAADSTQFSSCLLSGNAFVANYTTPNGPQPRPTMDEVKVAIFADHVELSGVIKGELAQPLKLKSPFLYYINQKNTASLQNVRQTTLGILQNALVTLQGEIGDKQLPKTVAYIMENRKTLQDALREVENKPLNSYELIEFSVSVKNAFHILDQAVGLASDRQIQMRDLIQLSK